MKIALVHDYIKEYGGAERVLEALHEFYPDAPVFTTVYLPDYLGPHRERFKDWDICTSFLQKIPFKAKLISPFRLLAPFVFRQFDFSKFDIVIVSATGAYNPNMIRLGCHPELDSGSRSSRIGMPKQVRHDNEGKPIHICYCHTPPRYLYGYATAREWKKNIIFRVLGEIANHFLRLIDYKSAQNVDYFIANSQEVASRIKKFYKREAFVIYPPVDIQASSSIASSVQLKNKELNANHLDAKRYYLAGGRLARPKHINLIIRSFEKLNLPLKIFGKGFGGYGNEISNIKYQISNIEFLGEITDEKKWELMRGAKAYIFASEDEDFGITPIEAMAAGTPVIAYRSGGVVESIVSGKTGIFFDNLSFESLVKAIREFENLTITSESCQKQAQKFSKERFKKEIKEFIGEVIKK